MRTFIKVLCLLGLVGNRLAHADWPQFRGPRGDGCADQANLPTEWGGLLNPTFWQTSLPGRGWSSPIVLGDRIWVTSAEETALSDTQRKRKQAEHRYSAEGQVFQFHASVDLLAIELDATSGKILRKLDLFTKNDPPPIHSVNSYASPTPVTDGERLYCHFGSLGTVCVELATGTVAWRQDFAVDDITGPGGSPVLWKDMLILACDGSDAQFVVALDKISGKVVWRTARPPIEASDGKLRRAFSTPLIIDHGGRVQLIAPAAHWIVSYNPANGEEWWRVKIGTGHALIPRPVYSKANEMVYVCTGYMKPELWALKLDGSGDVTQTHVVWAYGRQVPEISSPIVVDDQIYFVSTMGVATCLEASTGKTVWQHRLPGNYAASPLAADGKLYFINQQGTTTVLEKGPQYKELARNDLFGQTMASFAVYGDSLLIRTDPVLHCIRKTRPGENSTPLLRDRPRDVVLPGR